MTTAETTENLIKLIGELRWASIPPNPARKPFEIDPKEPNNSSYSIEVECSKAKFAELVKLGIPKLTTLREDEETGKTYLRVRATKTKGDYTFPDIQVIDKHGQQVTTAVANGSKGTVVIEASPIKGRKGVALRLKAVQVTDLIPFNGTKDYSNMFEIEANPHAEAEAHAQDLNPEIDEGFIEDGEPGKDW